MEQPRPADDPTPDSAPSGPWHDPPRGGHPSAQLAARPGAEMLRAMLEGTTPAPPLSHLTGMRLTAFTASTATFTMPLSPWLTGPDGRIPLGPLTIPADAAMACAVIAGLPAGTGLTTAELGLRQVRPVTPGGMLTAHGRMLEAGPPVALAEVSVTDTEGRLVAHGGSLCVTVAAAPAPEAPGPPEYGAEAAAPPGPDPWERPLPAGEVESAPLHRLIGLHRMAASAGEACFGLPATRWLCAPPPGRVQGGAVATLAEAALSAAIASSEPSATRFTPVEVKLNYLRPLASDGREARALARLRHAGRRTAVASTEVCDADGRMIAIATGSAMAERAA